MLRASAHALDLLGCVHTALWLLVIAVGADDGAGVGAGAGGCWLPCVAVHVVMRVVVCVAGGWCVCAMHVERWWCNC